MKTLLLIIAMLATIVATAQEIKPQLVEVNYSDTEVKEFDLNQPVKNSAQFRAVVSADPCLTTLALRDVFFESIQKDELLVPNNASLKRQLETAEELENDFIKLKCSKDKFLRWQKLKQNNYKLLNQIQ